MVEHFYDYPEIVEQSLMTYTEISQYNLSDMRFDFDFFEYNTLSFYAYVTKETKEIRKKRVFENLFFVFFNGPRRSMDLIWEMDDMFSLYTGNISKKSIEKIKNVTMIFCIFTGFAVFFMYAPFAI